MSFLRDSDCRSFSRGLKKVLKHKKEKTGERKDGKVQVFPSYG